jgi:ADP-ribose pyrophosphatase YjhB (NUDIX family)
MRSCARVAVVDGEGRLLLVEAHDRVAPHTGWLFLPGGGVEPGESEEAAAGRELAEEVGLELPLDDERGTVDVELSWAGRVERRREAVFVARCAERPALGELRPDEGEEWVGAEWWGREEAAASGLRLYPPQLPELLPEWR